MTSNSAPDTKSTDTSATWPSVDTAIDLLPSPEESDFRDALRSLLHSHGDIEEIRRVAGTDPGFSREIWTELAESMAITSMAIPESQGGLGFGMTFLAAALEECGRALRPEPLLGSAAIGVPALALSTFDSIRELRDQALAGEIIVVASPLSAESDQLTAQHTDGHWDLTGTAYPVAAAATADLLIVTAETGTGRHLFAVSREDSRIDPLESIDPTRPLTSVTCTDSSAHPLSTEPAETMSLRSRARIALAAENVGIAEHLLEMTREYTLSRRQFDRQIASFQAIKHRMADMLLDVERSRSATRYAAAHFDADPTSATLPAAAAAAVAMDAAHRVASDAIQLHGGIGFTWEHPAHNYYRRILTNEVLYGDASSHRRCIADLLGLYRNAA